MTNLLGQRIKARIAELGWSQRKLADSLSTTQATVSAWVLGKTTPDPDHLHGLSRVLGVSVAYLLSTDPNAAPSRPEPIFPGGETYTLGVLRKLRRQAIAGGEREVEAAERSPSPSAYDEIRKQLAKGEEMVGILIESGLPDPAERPPFARGVLLVIQQCREQIEAILERLEAAVEPTCDEVVTGRFAGLGGPVDVGKPVGAPVPAPIFMVSEHGIAPVDTGAVEDVRLDNPPTQDAPQRS